MLTRPQPMSSSLASYSSHTMHSSCFTTHSIKPGSCTNKHMYAHAHVVSAHATQIYHACSAACCTALTSHSPCLNCNTAGGALSLPGGLTQRRAPWLAPAPGRTPVRAWLMEGTWNWHNASEIFDKILARMRSRDLRKWPSGRQKG